MDRNDLRQSLKCINEGIETLKSGHSMVIFPEGKFSDEGTVSEFKPGSLKMAIKAGVPIVPITIRGSEKIMNRNILNKIRPAKVEVIISKPIYTGDIKSKDERELAVSIRNLIVDNLVDVQMAGIH